MKNKIIWSLSAVVLMSTQACQKELDLQPYQSISEEVALNTESNVNAVLTGAYNALGNGDIFGGGHMRNAELLGGDGEILWVGTFNSPREIANKQMIAANTDAQEAWLESYEVINIANNVLSALDVVSTDNKAKVEGEALFIRALTYFELVRFFAKPYEAGQSNTQPGIPLVLAPTRGVTSDAQVTRNTVEQVYDQVINDLKKAETQLPESNSWRASKFAATALLARVYLQKADYPAARDAANAVIASGKYSLLSDYADVFGRDANSSEDIFAIQVTTQNGTNAMNEFFSIPAFGGRDGDVEILEGHLSLYPTGDKRRALFFEGAGAFRTGKWNNKFGDLGIIRLAEMYLIRAETNLRLSTSVGVSPASDISTLRQRAGLSTLNSTSLDAILLERRLELAHEGFRIHDIKRTKASVGSFPYNDNKLVFPIPAREINANANLAQNDGY